MNLVKKGGGGKCTEKEGSIGAVTRKDKGTESVRRVGERVRHAEGWKGGKGILGATGWYFGHKKPKKKTPALGQAYQHMPEWRKQCKIVNIWVGGQNASLDRFRKNKLHKPRGPRMPGNFRRSKNLKAGVRQRKVSEGQRGKFVWGTIHVGGKNLRKGSRVADRWGGRSGPWGKIRSKGERKGGLRHRISRPMRRNAGRRKSRRACGNWIW